MASASASVIGSTSAATESAAPSNLVNLSSRRVFKGFRLRWPARVGAQVHMMLTVPQVAELFGHPAFLFIDQRGHERQAPKARHIRGELSGPATNFAGVYCEETGAYYNLDGYKRATNLATGDSWPGEGQDLYLTVYRVRTFLEAQEMYDKFNSAEGVKRSQCYFETGLRANGLIKKVNSPFLLAKGHATATRMGAGVGGRARRTADAVGCLAKGIEFVNDLDLPISSHVIVGVKAALLAIAQHSPSKALAEEFIRGAAAPQYKPLRTTAPRRFLSGFRDALKLMGTTGQKPNDEAFRRGLAAYLNFHRVASRQAPLGVEQVTLEEFKVAILQCASFKPPVHKKTSCPKQL